MLLLARPTIAPSGDELMPWKSLPAGEVADAARSIALIVSHRLRDIDTLKAALEATASKKNKNSQAIWAKSSTSSGSAGLAILFAYMDDCYPGEGWDLVGRQHLELAAASLESAGDLPIGLFGGLAGVGFAAHCLSRRGKRYQRLLDSVDDALSTQVEELCYWLRKQADGMSPSTFDVVSGLSGVTAYLLARASLGSTSDALPLALSTLVWLANDSGELPRWRTPPDLYLNPAYRERSPNGMLDCGLAHGIPGPLAVLSLASLNGIRAEGLEQAIDDVAAWIVDRSYEDGYGLNWSPMVRLIPQADKISEERIESCPSRFPPSRTAWCYGNPGVARALWLASIATGKKCYGDIAVAAMEAVLKRSPADRLIDSPTFCHGTAGLLQIVLRFRRDTQLDLFERAASELTRQIIEAFDSETLLGFQDLDNECGRLDCPALLEGAASIPLVLSAASSGIEPAWDRLFVLS